MDTETKIMLIRVGAVIALGALALLSWWMDYRWCKGPQGRGFLKIRK